MTNVAVLSRRERLADALMAALRGSAGVSGVLRIAEPALLPNGATIVVDPAAGTTPDLPWAEAALAEIARANPAHVVLISSAAVRRADAARADGGLDARFSAARRRLGEGRGREHRVRAYGRAAAVPRDAVVSV